MNRKKILLVLNGQEYSTQEMQFALQHYTVLGSLLVGMLLQELLPEHGKHAVTPDHYKQHLLDLLNKQANLKAVRFTMQPGPHHLNDLLRESHYADLAVLQQETFEQLCGLAKQKGLPDLLRLVSCPVVVLPETPAPVSQLVLLSNGCPESMGTIKAFINLFPHLCRELPTTLLLQKENCQVRDLESEKALVDYLRYHFKDLAVHKWCDDTAHTLRYAVDPAQHALLVHEGYDTAELPANLHTHNMTRVLNMPWPAEMAVLPLQDGQATLPA